MCKKRGFLGPSSLFISELVSPENSEKCPKMPCNRADPGYWEGLFGPYFSLGEGLFWSKLSFLEGNRVSGPSWKKATDLTKEDGR